MNIHSLKSLKLTKEYFIQKVLKYFNRIFRRDANMDDFDWQRYPEHYQAELADIKKSHTQVLTSGDYVFSEGALSLQKDILPLHSNARLLYETILQLSPDSLLEVGCGGGDHLSNLSTLSPNIRLYGCDRSIEQLSFLHKRHPNLKADIGQLDITLPYSSQWPVVDLCFSHAVIMRIHTDDNHLVALSNLFKTAKKYVVLMENWRSHDFMESIRNIFEKQMIPWDNLFFYYRISPELNKPHIMIVSPLKLNYEPLKKYDILL
ncbi:MAG: class I SAM-dependent methyltransferase [Candidatus Omnitrophica bacterium]|nr:class I SAM-dependent methyltransferase [Candidatus Omnitrophota bacterium]MBU1047378.1 class I SAM-dependent methyltransferase [Candidatus Omnitrophota bacterium]MBU1630181.1 class I SAM-dependent methyltransferase [Candidatus Omnitrophota bacterium]MBU1889037.1 class I SAM-dependent methyltransferase [Candidatus Omnitrophota bacterium]